MGSRELLPAVLFLLAAAVVCRCQSPDAAVMQELKKSISTPNQLQWSDPDPCKWEKVECLVNNRVVRIQIGNQNLEGFLPVNLTNLTALQFFEVQGNQFSGPLPSLTGLTALRRLLLHNNNFTSIPPDFFAGMSSLEEVYLEFNPFSSWAIPQSLLSATSLRNFSATGTNLSGSLPDFWGFDKFPGLINLRLALNNLEGPLPLTLSGSLLQCLWLNGQMGSSRLNGSITILQNMTQLTQVWLHGNMFSGPLPDFTALTRLQDLNLRDNSFTGPVPESLTQLKSLLVVNLTDNMFQGKTPKFNGSVKVDMNPNSNSFCSAKPGLECDPRIDVLLDVVQSVGYPSDFAGSWKGNDPCASWKGVTCINGNITVVNFHAMSLSGTISPMFSQLTTLERLILSDNNLTGTIPNELVHLPQLTFLDVSNNQIEGKVPAFRSSVILNIDGNVNIGKNAPTESHTKKNHIIKVISLSIFAGLSLLVLVLATILCFITIALEHPAADSSNPNDGVEAEQGDLHLVEAGSSSMVLSIQVLKSATNDFSEQNKLGSGGFGTVYRGELPDGIKVAVKRMESGAMRGKGLEEFKSEIEVLTKVKHKHLVELLGYCLEGNERLLVYEYMAQGTLSRFIFDWKDEGLMPLDWPRRLAIALDVARGIEYLHGLARQSFIHRDLKPWNILLDDDMRAKVADFGLVRPVPRGEESLTASKMAGTFGYVAPDYAATGRVTTKIDVYSFGVILMELITGRKALDKSLPAGCLHLMVWCRGKLGSKDTFREAIDPNLHLDEETCADVLTVAELASHCSAEEPDQRPDMRHAVNVLSSLAERWKPATERADPSRVGRTLNLAEWLEKWEALEEMSDSNSSEDGSTPPRPPGFADSFREEDGR